MATNNIVLIHGLWTTPLSFEFWSHHYSELGYRVFAPSWPGMERDIRALRRSPESYAGLGIRQIVDHYEQFVLALDEPPILVGNGFGGLVVQALLDRGLGTCGVAVASAPIKGIWTLPYTTMRMVTPQLVDAGMRGCVRLPASLFHHAFLNTSSREEAQQAYDRYIVPGSRRVVLQAEWEAHADQWLPTAEDRAFVASLMGRVVEPGKFAGWIAPPMIGINRQPVNFEYVRFN